MIFFLYQALIAVLLILSPLIISIRILKKKKTKKDLKKNFVFLQKKELRET